MSGKWPSNLKHQVGTKQQPVPRMVGVNQVGSDVLFQDAQAAMWAAGNTDLMYQIMEDNPRIKTVRGYFLTRVLDPVGHFS